MTHILKSTTSFVASGNFFFLGFLLGLSTLFSAALFPSITLLNVGFGIVGISVISQASAFSKRWIRNTFRFSVVFLVVAIVYTLSTGV